MFSAVQNNGELFYLFPRHSRKVLEEKRRNEAFYCPECKEKVVLKLGAKRIEHFAHQKGSQCTESYERESAYHMEGKLQLYHWLEAQKFTPVLEPYYPSIRQRPDVGFVYDDKSYALEFQCSVLPSQLMEKRTKQYRKIQTSVLWLLGGKNIKRKGERKVSLTAFDYYFVTRSSSGSWYLLAFCPASKVFIILSNLTPVSTKNAFARFSIIPMEKFTVENLSFQVQQHPFTSAEWRREIQWQKQKIQQWGIKQHHDFVQELYLSGLHIALLPPFIGLPVPSAIFMEYSPLIWQTYFFIDHIYQRQMGELITVNDVFQAYVKRLGQGRLKERILPLVEERSILAPFIEYLQVLEHVQILERVNTNTFKVKQMINIPEHPARQQELENEFYQHFAEMLFS